MTKQKLAKIAKCLVPLVALLPLGIAGGVTEWLASSRDSADHIMFGLSFPCLVVGYVFSLMWIGWLNYVITGRNDPDPNFDGFHLDY